jgi:hypothetical protein
MIEFLIRRDDAERTFIFAIGRRDAREIFGHLGRGERLAGAERRVS